MTHDLAAWLRAQLDDDERGRLLLADMLERLAVELDGEAQESEDGGGYTEPQVFRWAAQHVRDRAAELVEEYRQLRLAEVDAKRRILAFHEGEHDCPEVVTGVYPDDWPTGASHGKPGERWSHMRVEHFEADEPCPTQRLFALPFADRPGYREEWKP